MIWEINNNDYEKILQVMQKYASDEPSLKEVKDRMRISLSDRTPEIPLPVPGHCGKTHSGQAALRAWTRCDERFLCVLEEVGARPGQGTASMNNASRNARRFAEAEQALGISLHMVLPQAWKRRAGLLGTEKDAARAMAIRLYPDFRALDQKEKGKAIADAILIARFGMIG